MKYYVVYQTTKDGKNYEKWIPSSHYSLSAEHLLIMMEHDTDQRDILIIPFILTIAASLEANLNDWFLIDTFAKHGENQARIMVEGYTGISFAKKLRLVVPILTDNTFQVKEDSPIIRTLDNLISSRNKITHPLVHFQNESPPAESEKRHSKIMNHPLHTLTIADCKRYFKAVEDFDEKFFKQYDKGHIIENDLIREIPPIGKRVD